MTTVIGKPSPGFMHARVVFLSTAAMFVSIAARKGVDRMYYVKKSGDGATTASANEPGRSRL